MFSSLTRLLVESICYLGFFITCLAAEERIPLATPTSQESLLPPNSDSYGLAVSEDGTKVLFRSTASNLVPNDHNGTAPDLFLYDRVSKHLKLITVNSEGFGTPNEAAGNAMMTPDGRFIFFESEGTNVIPGKTNRVKAIYLQDVLEGTTSLISQATNNPSLAITPNGDSEISAITPDGRYVLYESSARNLHPLDQNSAKDIFVRDVTNKTNLLAHASFARVQLTPSANIPGTRQFNASLTHDGNFILFQSSATNLVPGDGNLEEDIFLRDMQLKTNYLVSYNFNQTGSALSPSIQKNGSTRPVMNRDARIVAFSSSATNLISPHTTGTGIFIRNLSDGSIHQVPRPVPAAPAIPSIYTLSPDGRLLAYSYNYIVYLWDTNLRTNVAVSILSSPSSGGTAGGGEPQQPYDGKADYPVFSDDGKVLAFRGNSFRKSVHVIEPGVELTIQAVPSLSTPLLTKDGQQIIFESLLPLTAEDKNRFIDVYSYDVANGSYELISRGRNATASTGLAGTVLRSTGVSADGSLVGFVSRASNLAPNDTNGFPDIFLKPLPIGTPKLVSRSHDGRNPGNGSSVEPALARQGNMLAFLSSGTNLVPGFQWSSLSPYKSNRYNLYLYDVVRDKVTLASTNSTGQAVGVANKPLTISSNGRFVLFFSASMEWRNDGIRGETLYMYDTQLGSFAIIGTSINGAYIPVHVSAEGTVLYIIPIPHRLFRKVAGGEPEMLHYTYGVPAVAADGRYVFGFDLTTGNRAMYFMDTSTGKSENITPAASSLKGTNDALRFSMTEDAKFGAFVDYQSSQWNLYKVQLQPKLGKWNPVFQNSPFNPNPKTDSPMLSPDGRYLLFRLDGPHDINGKAIGPQIYLKDRITGKIRMISHLPGNALYGNGRTMNPFFSPDGTRVFFHSLSSMLTSDANAETDVFYLDLAKPDSDNDGLDDDWEVTWFSNLGENGDDDYDLDGASNSEEFLAGTNPIDQASILAVLVTRSLPGATTVSVETIPRNLYLIQYKNTVEDEWHDLFPPMVANGSQLSRVDPETASYRFYRAVLLQ